MCIRCYKSDYHLVLESFLSYRIFTRSRDNDRKHFHSGPFLTDRVRENLFEVPVDPLDKLTDYFRAKSTRTPPPQIRSLYHRKTKRVFWILNCNPIFVCKQIEWPNSQRLFIPSINSDSRGSRVSYDFPTSSSLSYYCLTCFNGYTRVGGATKKSSDIKIFF